MSARQASTDRTGSPLAPDAPIEVHISSAGDSLHAAFSGILEAMPDATRGPQVFSKQLGVDKVLASRLLKAMRSPDPMGVLHRIPGPEPLRRVLKGAARQGVDPALIEEARGAVDRFERLIRHQLGDRSALEAILSAWTPEARREFELRRKQAAHKALSQLKGAQAETIMATVFLHPSREDATRLDVLWINGLFGLRRLRPGAGVKLATRRMTPTADDRAPRTLDGDPVETLSSLFLEEFCTDPLPRFDVHRNGETVHYTLADEAFGPSAAVNLVLAEANYGDIARYVSAEQKRKGYVFAETSTPARTLQFDALVHEDVYPDSEPGLRIYDTAFEGVADVNDPAREIDQLDLLETIERLGVGVHKGRSGDVPRYDALLRTACERMKWDPDRFRVYRCRVDYPLYGSQIAMMFTPPAWPDAR